MPLRVCTGRGERVLGIAARGARGQPPRVDIPVVNSTSLRAASLPRLDPPTARRCAEEREEPYSGVCWYSDAPRSSSSSRFEGEIKKER